MPLTRRTCSNGCRAPASPLPATTGRTLSRLRSRGRLAALQPAIDQEVVLLVDEGVHFFDLRAIYIRGRVKPAEAPNGAPAGRTWFEVIPLKTVAWDYGTLREVKDER